MSRNIRRTHLLVALACVASVGLGACNRAPSQTNTGPTSMPTTRRSTVVGDVRYHNAFHSKILNNDRRLIVWLPPGYEKGQQRYPVLYMHDGQNLFDDATSFLGEWHADETATMLIEQKRIEPIIIVGVENTGTSRLDEYTPTEGEDRTGATTRRAGGRGELYAQFLIQEVKPFIDATYRTMPDREHTAVAGSSLGGLISLYLGYQHGDVFSMIGVMSPSLFWDHGNLLFTLETDNAWMKRERFWIDIGTAEGVPEDYAKHVRLTRELHAIVQRAGLVENRDYRYLEAEGAAHNERAWGARFDQVLLFFFGTSSQPRP